MIKKLTTLLLVGAMLLMTACISTGGSEPAAASTAQSTAAAQPASTTPAAEGETIRIGVVYPMSGPFAESGKQYLDAMQFAADIINNANPDIDMPFAATEGIPSMGGAKIEFVVADDQNSPELGMSETERLITEQNVVAIMGCLNSGVTKTASAAAELLGIPFLCPNSSSVELTSRGFEWFFRTSPNDNTFIADTYKYMDTVNSEQNAEIKKLVLVVEDTDYGVLLQRGFTETAEEAGYDIVEQIIYPANSTNVTSEVIKIINAEPDAVIMGSYASDAILFINAFSEQNFQPKAIIGQRGGFVAPELLSGLGSLAEGIATTNLWAVDLGDNSPLIKQIYDMYCAHCQEAGIDFSVDFSRAVTAVMTMADALERAGSTEPEALRDALRATDITNEGQMIVAWDGVQFDETGQNIRSTGIVTQVIDGVFQTVWPTAHKAHDPVIPIPAWDER